MLLGRVVGEVWGARQAPGLAGCKLLVIQPLSARAADGKPRADGTASAADLVPTDARVVAVDRLGAGLGELVLVAHGSRSRDLTCGPTVATKEVVIAIVDDAAVALAPSQVTR